jgi:RNA polymerase sigma-70 factor (ECF subfamily)
VLRAADAKTASALESLEELCRTYWYPLYAYVRRKGHSPENASDLTQEFFARLLKGDFPAGIEPGKGRFRSFLLTALNRFLIDEWKKTQTAKRGSGSAQLSLDALIWERGESQFQIESTAGQSPERLFDRAWAETMLENVLKKLASECRERGDNRFRVLRPFLTAGDDPPTLAEAATQLNLSLPGFKSLLHRFRSRYRELLLAEVGQTLSTKEGLRAEIEELMAAVRRD